MTDATEQSVGHGAAGRAVSEIKVGWPRPGQRGRYGEYRMTSLRIKKLCNAFVPDAEMIDDIPILSRTVVKAAKGAVDRYKAKHGGLWVGGSVLITDDGLAFAPTGINIDLHRELSTVLIMREEIKAVQRDFGWLTGIVAVTHTTGEFRFRCFGAKTVVDRMVASFALDRRYAE